MNSAIRASVSGSTSTGSRTFPARPFGVCCTMRGTAIVACAGLEGRFGRRDLTMVIAHYVCAVTDQTRRSFDAAFLAKAGAPGSCGTPASGERRARGRHRSRPMQHSYRCGNILLTIWLRCMRVNGGPGLELNQPTSRLSSARSDAELLALAGSIGVTRGDGKESLRQLPSSDAGLRSSQSRPCAATKLC
jgi:hypothetical protein